MRSHRTRALCLSVLTFVALMLGWPSAARALQAPQAPGRFSGLVIPDPSAEVSPEVVPLASARVSASLQSGWASFWDRQGPDWDVYLDARSGAPILVQGQGIPLVPGGGNALASTQPVTLDSLATLLRGFVAKNASLLLADDKELALDAEGSGQITPDLWQVVFAHQVAGVPVAGDRYVFYVGHGNLIAFGASRWSPVAAGAAARISRQEAFAFLSNHLRLDDRDHVDVYDPGTLVHVPMAAAGTGLDSFDGAVGSGYQTVLAWRIALYVDGEPGALEGLVDAHSGAILSVRDLAQYARVKGGVFPASDDGICPGGCEQGNVPMPSANISIGTNNQTAGSMGLFSCTPGGSTAVTTLAGPYIRVADSCGAVSISTTCDSDLDLGTSEGTDCGVPVGSSPGNTHAARTSFYHLNRIKEHVRAWLPSNTWIDQRLTTNVNINNTCNAYWSGGASGTVNFYRSGGGCRNTGEISSILLHEWGHGLDDNDGGGMDNPSEAYSDITAFMVNHASCMSRGFSDTNCGGYGNACLSCTGIRDSDWNQRANHAPQTPENWPSSCPVGTGPCRKEVHCEAALAAETLWDLTVRDLPAAGIDQPTAWQIVDRLWFKSRQGSGGDAYTCGSPVSNRSCAATAWFTKLRALDDDDGNLANGTPHAAQIFSAFSRHNIPCGASTDAANRNTSSCPSLVAPTVATTPGFGQVALSWTAVPSAATYNVLRNDQGCNWGYTIVATVTGTTYTDTNLPDYYPVYYAIQPVGSNSACVGPLSACTTAQAGGPRATYAGSSRVADSCSAGGAGANDGIYDAGELIQFSVAVKNDGVVQLTGVTATVTSTTAGVTMVAGTAGYPNLAVGATGSSTSPHFRAQLPSTLACGSPVNYNLTINADQGSWSGSFSQIVGQPLTAGGTVLAESFSGGIPVTWEVSDGGDGGGAAATWTTANPGGRVFIAPLVAPVAIVDSSAAGYSATQDELLITPALNLSAASSVTLAYDEYYRYGSGDIADVLVKSSRTGGALVNVLHLTGYSTPEPYHRTIDITAQAAGAPDVKIWFHYWNGQGDYYWQLDNITVTWTGPAGCNMRVCAIAACGNGTTEAGEQCDDGNTQNGDCCSSACQYEAAGSPCGSPTSSTCTAPDSCNPTGLCQANNAPNGAACNDGNACTQPDSCQSGACTGPAAGPPPEVANQRFSSRTHLAWDAALTAGPTPVYDVVRGLAASLPVGSAGEQCRASGIASTGLDDAPPPAAGSAFWYLVRARNACGIGTYGTRSGGAPRLSTACP